MSDLYQTSDAIVITFQSPNLDQQARNLVETELVELARKGQPVVLDMRNVEFADSAGLRMIQTILKQNNNQICSLVNVGPRLERCLNRLPESRRPAKSPKMLDKTVDTDQQEGAFT